MTYSAPVTDEVEVSRGRDWAVTSGVAVLGALATCGQPGAPGVVHVVTSISYSIVNTAAAAQFFVLELLDGATVIWTKQFGLGAGPLTIENNLGGLNIGITPGNTVTLQFNTGFANYYQTVNLTGYDATV